MPVTEEHSDPHLPYFKLSRTYWQAPTSPPNPPADQSTPTPLTTPPTTTHPPPPTRAPTQHPPTTHPPPTSADKPVAPFPNRPSHLPLDPRHVTESRRRSNCRTAERRTTCRPQVVWSEKRSGLVGFLFGKTTKETGCHVLFLGRGVKLGRQRYSYCFCWNCLFLFGVSWEPQNNSCHVLCFVFSIDAVLWGDEPQITWAGPGANSLGSLPECRNLESFPCPPDIHYSKC